MKNDPLGVVAVCVNPDRLPSTIPIASLHDVQDNPLSATPSAIRAQHADIADAIMHSQARTFALAVDAGNADDITLTKEALRQQIYLAINAAFDRGREWQERHGGRDVKVEKIEESLT